MDIEAGSIIIIDSDENTTSNTENVILPIEIVNIIVSHVTLTLSSASAFIRTCRRYCQYYSTMPLLNTMIFRDDLQKVTFGVERISKLKYSLLSKIDYTLLLIHYAQVLNSYLFQEVINHQSEKNKKLYQFILKKLNISFSTPNDVMKVFSLSNKKYSQDIICSLISDLSDDSIKDCICLMYVFSKNGVIIDEIYEKYFTDRYELNDNIFSLFLKLVTDPIRKFKNGKNVVDKIFANNDISMPSGIRLLGDRCGADLILGNGLPAIFAAAACKSSRPMTMEYLIQGGNNVNHQDSNGNTPIHFVINPDNIKFLIENGANLFHVNNEGKTLLDSRLCGKCANDNVIKCILEIIGQKYQK